jgi:hypothetical protein
MQERLDRLAAQLRQYREGRDLQGVRYPESLRRLAVDVCEQCLEAGDSVSRVAVGLGIAPGTLDRWRSSSPERVVGFRRVEMVASDSDSGSITLISPSGYRIEGLTPSQAAELLVAVDAG